MENLEMMSNFWSSKDVLITGHTGFKGGWLTLWLSHLGANVHGFALEPSTSPSFFKVCNISQVLKTHRIGDIRNRSSIERFVEDVEPQIVFHLAAQPLVRESYLTPFETFDVNVLGTVNLLDSLRNCNKLKAIVNITTDKCYENQEWDWPYRENEPLGGHDPYSASKACSEIVSASYRRSFLESKGISLATARAGNVIGGGDWAIDRLIPDFLKSVESNQPLIVRSPNAIRPWQHVLEPLFGYISLAEALFLNGSSFASAWNFGPEQNDSKSVSWILQNLCEKIPGATWNLDSNPQLHEAKSLKLDSSKAKSQLRWSPKWDLSTALLKTLDWHGSWRNSKDMQDFSLNQIKQYQSYLLD